MFLTFLTHSTSNTSIRRDFIGTGGQKFLMRNKVKKIPVHVPAKNMNLFLLGLFFIMPCVDTYKKVDLRTVSFDVPPQEVKNILINSSMHHLNETFI